MFARHHKSKNIRNSDQANQWACSQGAGRYRNLLCARIRNSQIHTSRRSLLNPDKGKFAVAIAASSNHLIGFRKDRREAVFLCVPSMIDSLEVKVLYPT